MIVYDFSAYQQSRDQIMNRHAADFENPKQARQEEERNVSWEDFANMEVSPRRSPWRTADEDILSTNPTVSQNQITVTPENINRIIGNATSGTFVSEGGGLNEAQIISLILRGDVISRISAAVISSLPIIEFKCPG